MIGVSSGWDTSMVSMEGQEYLMPVHLRSVVIQCCSEKNQVRGGEIDVLSYDSSAWTLP